MSELTELQRAIKETIEAHPYESDDHQIAKLTFERLNPDEEYAGKNPSKTYIGKVRKKIKTAAEPPTFTIETPPEPVIEPEPTDPGTDENLEIPYEEAEPSEAGDFIAIPSFDEEVEVPKPETEKDRLKKEAEIKANLDDVGWLIQLPFEKMADFTGYEGWRLDEKGKEEKRFFRYSKAILDRYAPDLLYKYFLEVLFCATLAGIISTRYKGWREYKEAHQPRKDINATIIREAEQEAPEPEIIEPEAPAETPPSPVMGELALGEDEMKRRLGMIR